MNPQAVTVGARVARRLTPIILIAAARSADRVAFLGGVLATVAGAIAGAVGPKTAAELLRTSLGHVERKPQLELPPGVRLAIASATTAGTLEAKATGAMTDGDPVVIDALQRANDDQLEAMRRVLAVVATKAGIDDDKLIKLLDAAIVDVRDGRPPHV